MRAVVLSDSHGDEEGLRWMLQLLWQQIGPVDFYFHLGDGALDFERLSRFLYARDPQAIPLGVRGNCDFACGDVPEFLVQRFGGCRLLLTHGHRYGVKHGLDALRWAAHENACRAALFGHTHVPFSEEENGCLLLNPGSARDGRLAVLEEHGGRLSARLYSF